MAAPTRTRSARRERPPRATPRPGSVPVIEVSNLRKEFGDLVAVEDASFSVDRGEIFGLLGPNGAGKSTTIGCLSGLLTCTAGRVLLGGHDVSRAGLAARRLLGVVPQELAVYEEVSARENLRYWGTLCGLRGNRLARRVDEVLEQVGLADRAGDPVRQHSGGMKRRLNFACGVVHEPQVLLLDEPTVGVDPQSRVRLLDLVRAQRDAGTCVLYTTHYMEEAETLCDRLAVMDHGRLVALGTLAELRERMGQRDLLRLAGNFDEAAVRRVLAGQPDLDVVQAEGDSLTLSLRDASRRLPALFEALSGAGADVRETTLTQPSLETLFIQLTGHELRE